MEKKCFPEKCYPLSSNLVSTSETHLWRYEYIVVGTNTIDVCLAKALKFWIAQLSTFSRNKCLLHHHFSYPFSSDRSLILSKYLAMLFLGCNLCWQVWSCVSWLQLVQLPAITFWILDLPSNGCFHLYGWTVLLKRNTIP